MRAQFLHARGSSFFADDKRRHHAAARRDVGEFGERKTREGGADLAEEQERIEIDELLGKLERAVRLQSRKRFARRAHAFLQEIVAV